MSAQAESLIIRQDVHEHRGQHRADHQPQAPIVMQLPPRRPVVAAMIVFVFYCHG
jgi:hypothetical protein